VVQVHAGLGAPVEDVGRQHALDERGEAGARGRRVQLAQQVWQHRQRGRVLALLVQPGPARVLRVAV